MADRGDMDDLCLLCMSSYGKWLKFVDIMAY